MLPAALIGIVTLKSGHVFSRKEKLETGILKGEGVMLIKNIIQSIFVLFISITTSLAYAGGGYDSYGGDRGFAAGLGGVASAGELGLSGEEAQGYNTAVSVLSDHITSRISYSTSMTSTQRESAMNEAKGQLDTPGSILGAMVETEAVNSAVGGGFQTGLVDAVVDGIIDGVLSQFSGRFMGTELDLSKATLHPNSRKIVKRLKDALSSSGVIDPIARIGLKGSKILVFENLGFSFYWKENGVIHLAIEDIQKYGMAVLLHELMHAGLESARKSGTITSTEFWRLNNLNQTAFKGLNGYVGTAQGYFDPKGYAHQEAFAVGHSFALIQGNQNRISSQTAAVATRALQYKADILDNIRLRKMPNGKILKMINSGAMTRSQVKQSFTDKFIYNTWVKNGVTAVSTKVRDALPKLCRPGAVIVHARYACNGTSDEVYENDWRKTQQVCGDNLKWGAKHTTSCGNVINYR